LDRRGPPAVLTLLLAAVSLAAAGDAPPLVEMRWLAPGVDRAAALSTQPVECLPAGEQPLPVEIGRAAFRSPLLLGGVPARAGLSCDSCHRNGRGNPGFLFPGVSGAPGTADVTSSLFSSHRGDGVDDPRPIPDLGVAKSALKVPQDPASPALERFVRGLIVEEFDGAEPPRAVVEGVAAYVRAMRPCDGPDRPLRAGDLVDDARRAVLAGESALAAGDPDTPLVMVAAARSRLGRLDERYAALPDAVAALRAADRELAAIAAAIRVRAPDSASRLAAWRKGLTPLADRLADDEPRSLFDRTRLGLLAGGR